MTGLFARFQPVYAEHGITTVPCSTDSKTALIKHWPRVGINGSHRLATKFTTTNALGILCGPRNRLAVLDIDSTNHRVLDDAVARHGEPRIIIRTASGKYHCYYRHNGEGRRIRPWPDRPIDLLGNNGIVYGAPSLYARGQYEIIQGTLDDLCSLTTLRGIDDLNQQRTSSTREKIPKGRRNNTIWRHCMRQAHHCDDLDALLDVARTYNQNCIPSLEDKDIMIIAQSAWDYTQSGRNRFGQHGAWIPVEDVASMMTDPDALALFAYLKVNEGPWARFMILNSMAEKFGWTLRRLQNARNLLIDMERIKQIKRATTGSPAFYQWAE